MLTLVGMNHRSAPLDLRERLALSGSEVGSVVSQLRADPAVAEAFCLSTCNRVEFLVRGSNSEAGHAIDRYLKTEYDLDRAILDRHAYRRQGREAIRHLFRVAAGLDSMILGEPQILGQVKDAFAASRDAGTTGVVVDRLLQHALSAAKRARSETGISRHAVSVASAAVKLAHKIFGKLDDRRVLMLGAGKMGELVARHLKANGVPELIVCGRRFNNADRAARRFGARAVHWDDGLEQLHSVDIVIGCTGAPRPVVTRKQVARALRKRRAGALFLIDIAVPRDIESSVHSLDNVYLYDIDALEGVVDDNLEERRRAAQQAEKLIDGEVKAFERWREAHDIGPMIAALRKEFLETGERELQRFRGRLEPLTESQAKVLQELTRSLTRKFLDRPTRFLRESATRGESGQIAPLLLRAFELEIESGDGSSEAQGDGERGDDGVTGGGPQRLVRGGRDDG
ncbi:MAG: glutamyl-tRNA reductase [Acidobacteria bacterium]|nr:glutamyl-tRNA reductase [Acidobacteriota bacterium]NIO59512.1 glutamyl-tRNA reductase [Acidobacteriota bacterium]NIQ85489.1 glutamyl-tRNA reductase [Acidobacteriota bacterium]NIT11219.1 glutamyl-tRNA reductase [Acidobacteriota bacterium]